MGAEITTVNREDNRNVKQQTGRTGEGAEDRSAEAAATSTRTGERTGRSTGADTGAGEKAGEEKDISGVAFLTPEEKQKFNTVDEKEQKRLLRNAKRRERYRQQTSGTKNQSKKQDIKPPDTATINMLLASLFSVIGSRQGCEHWILTESEIKSLKIPSSSFGVLSMEEEDNT